MTNFKQRRLLIRSILPAGAAAALGSLGLLGGCGDGRPARGNATSDGTGKSTTETAELGDACLPPLQSEPIDAAAIQPTLAKSLFEIDETNQAATFRHVDLIHPTRPIRQNPCRARALEPAPHYALSSLRYPFKSDMAGIDDYMRRNRTVGLLIMKDGKVALERYGMGQTDTSKWTSFSLTKSFTSTLAGAAVLDGQLDLSQPVSRYLNRDLVGRYADVTIENLLRMRSGIGWQELDFNALLAVFMPALQKHGGQKGDVLSAVVAIVHDLEQDVGVPQFRYSTPDSIVLGNVVQAAIGRPLNTYLQEKIWEPAGMECDAYWLSESAAGNVLGGAGLSATLRDFGRFGQFILTGAKGRDGKSILPPDWARSAYVSGPNGGPGRFVPAGDRETDGYGYQWWIVGPNDSGRADDTQPPIFYASGLMGQRIFIDPVTQVVMVVLSAWHLPLFDPAYFDRNAETMAMLRAAIGTMR
jgi:CubicO group peptidase (beta-lactamase class C family)